MDEFPGLLSRDFGLRPQGKAAPMSASKNSAFGSASGFGSTGGGMGFPGDLLGGGGGGQRSSGRRDDGDDIFFGGGAARAPPPKYASASAAFASDPFFSMGAAKTGSSPSVDAGFSASMPVYDKPVYDDDDGDIFSGVPGMKKSSSASAAAQNNVFSPPAYEDDLLASLGGSRPASRGPGDNGRPGAASGNASPTYGDDDLLSTFGRSGGSKESGAAAGRSSPPYDDDLLASIGGGRSFGDEKRSGSAHSKHSPPAYEDDLLAGLSGVPKHSSNEGRSRGQDVSGFDELIPGFGGSSPPRQKSGQSESKQQHSSVSSTKATVTVGEDPFVVLESTSAKAHSSSGLSTDPLEHINKPSGSLKSDGSSAKAGVLFDDINGFDGFMKSIPSFSSDIEDNKDRSPLETTGKVSAGEASTKSFDKIVPRMVPDDKSHQTMFEKPSKSSESFKSVHMNGLNFDANAGPYDASSGVNATQKPEEQHVVDDDVWLTVSEIPLFTQPTSAAPPSRSPPPPTFRSKQAPFTSQSKVSSGGLNTRRKVSESSFPQPTEGCQFYSSHNDVPTRSAVSSLDELEEFAMGKPYGYANEAQPGEEENEANSTAAASAAAMKQAMDRAEAKFKHAREARERDLKFSKNKETPPHVVDEDEKEKERLDHEREQREREEKEQRRLEKMRELELEREREKARQAVERATREARERAAAEARQKAEKVAREQAERAAVQRAHAEARERAAAEARERAEKLAAERERAEAEARERVARERAAEREREEADGRERAARERAAREKAAVAAREKAERAAVERAATEARARAQRAAVERATAEARERAAAEARERAAAMAREKHQKNENDLSSFFGMGARATSAPKERAAPSGSAFDTQFQNTTRASSVSTSSMKRPSSTTNIMDDLTSVFGTQSNDEFQEIEGEPEERRRARLERERKARERAAKALAEKNEREMQMQREQAERDRISDTLNIEIRRWAAGKEGNLRALLSTLQYVLWPDSSWQPVSLTDLITAASVKKVYRKATLCVHPDKVVNGTVQQKYIAEKVFDLLKESWNKFNSEELF